MDRREEGTGEGVGVSERQGPGTSRGGGGLPSHLPGPSPVPRPWEVFREDLPANHYVRKMPGAFAHFSATSPM